MAKNGIRTYIADLRNWLDIMGLICWVIYSAFGYLNDHEETMHYWFTYSMILGLMRGGTTFFQQFQTTSYLIQMTKACISDLIPFLLVLNGQIIIFGIIFQQLEEEDEKFISHDPKEYENANVMLRMYLKSWDFMLGTQVYKFQNLIGFAVYIIATIQINISMLNMVISVVADTYEKV